ncbi:MAG: hypothetical protein J7M08_01700 [Planctomycetes bacterium]|nr:hypothetical protein [Planctomycetota bacterium]
MLEISPFEPSIAEDIAHFYNRATTFTPFCYPVTHIELVRGGEVIYRHAPASKQDAPSFEFRDRRALQSGTHYYIRVMQEDGHQAFASPVYVDPEGE